MVFYLIHQPVQPVLFPFKAVIVTAFPTDIQFIETAEKALGVSLPSTWRRRLLSLNGGELFVAEEDWTVFPVRLLRQKEGITHGKPHRSREPVCPRVAWFPPAAVAIAENGSGDYLVFLPSPSSSSVLDNRVLLWSHETGLAIVAEEVESL